MVADLLTISMDNTSIPSTKHAAPMRTRTSRPILLKDLEHKICLLGLPNGRTDAAAAH